MIRFADMNDFDGIISMMKHFANAAPLKEYHEPKYNYRGVQNYLCSILKNGFILVAEKDQELVGMIIAAYHTDPWLPQIQNLKELAWWVEPKHRNSSIGYRLLKEYVRCGKKLKQEGKINNFVISTLAQSPIRDIERHGWRAVETNYVYED
jgi:GNAT superfamily N-acetyltransferase